MVDGRTAKTIIPRIMKTLGFVTFIWCVGNNDGYFEIKPIRV